ncbi:MAG: cation:proton antiporter [Myxococcota bacterium]
MPNTILTELLLLLAVATAGAALFERLKLPAIAAFLVIGALVGPGGVGLIDDPERVRELAEFGVVFLLFEIGLELPLERLRVLWREALLVGGLQVTATVASVAAIGVWLGLDTRAAIVMGALVAMSSTALVMRLLMQRGEVDAPQGQLAVGILLFQDLCVVPFLLMIPILASDAGTAPATIAFAMGRAAVMLAAFYLVARFVIPAVLERMARVRSRELFTMVAVVAVLGSALVAEAIGLTLSVGAFVGGLVLSASPYAHQLFAEIIPMRGLLLAVFFTAVGMLFDPQAALENWVAVLAYTGGVVALKAGFIAAVVAFALRRGLRLGILTGLALAQTGEFSFVLAAAAADANLIDAGLRQVFVAGSLVTLVATPFLVQASPKIAGYLARRAEVVGPEPSVADGQPAGHVALVGFGLTGQNLARVLAARNIPYVAVEANAVSVRQANARNEPVIYGDATRRSILERIGIRRAGLVVVSINDRIATREVVALARALAPRVPILARTHHILDVDELESKGATRVVVEEFESTLELVGETLRAFGVPDESVARFSAELRSEGYEFLREYQTILDPWLAQMLEEVTSHWVEVPDDYRGEASLSDLHVRRRTGANVVAVDRRGVTTPNPDPSFVVRAGDRLLALGEPAAVEDLGRLFGDDGTGP